MKEVGKAPGRTKKAMLKRELGPLNMVEIDRERIVKFGRARAKEGAGPVTLSMDVGLIKLVLQHAAAVHGLPIKVEPVDLGRVALKRLAGGTGLRLAYVACRGRSAVASARAGRSDQSKPYVGPAERVLEVAPPYSAPE